MNAKTAPQRESSPTSSSIRSASNRLLLGALLSLAPSAGHAQSELIRNGGFDEVLADWTIPSALSGESPYVHLGPGGYLTNSLQNFGYLGTLVRQNLNVPGIANQTINTSIDMKAKWEFAHPSSIELAVEFSRSDGSITRTTALSPDYSSIGNSSFTTVSNSFTFPTDAERLLAVTIERVGEGNYFGDNVSLTSSLTPEALPVLGQVAPTQVAFGDTVQITGSGFGTLQGSVLVAASESGVVINSWSDTLIEVTVNDPCGGGLVTVVLPSKVQTSESQSIAISSPHFTATRFFAAGFDQELRNPIAVPGQVVPVNVDIDCHNGCAPAGGITFSIPEAPTASLHPANIAGDGGTRIEIDTTGLAPGLHTFTITASATGFAPRTFPFTVDVRNPGTLSFEYQDNSFNWLPVPDPFPFTSQKNVSVRAILLDDGGNDITDHVDLTISTCNATVIQAWNASQAWDSSVVMPQDNGSCTISVNGPGAISSDYPVTVAIPVHPKIETFTIVPTDTDIDNSGTSTFVITVTASQPMSGFSWTSGGGLQSTSGEFSNGNHTYTDTLKVSADVKPGIYTLEVSATIPGGGASRAKIFEIVSNPAAGMITGYQALMRDPFQSHGATGTVEFYDPSTGLKSFERMLPWGESWDYYLPNIPAGTYKLRWVTGNGPGYPVPQWSDNAYDIANAAEVVIAPGATLSNLNFFLDLLPDTLSPLPIPSETLYNAANEEFQCTAPVEVGFTYGLLKSTSFKDGSWYQVDTANGESGTATFKDSAATDPKAFYQIIRR